MDGVILEAAKKFINVQEVSGNSSQEKETGGKIIVKDGEAFLAEIQNQSLNKKRFTSEIPEADFYDNSFIGLWHTHQSYSIPSPPDFYQMIKLNLMFKKNFKMIIIGRRKISVTSFKYLIFPNVKFETIKNV
jgi:sulfite reductase beta subunit-like hemoprotein